eukprot:jgi/Botrbrau1/19842/Bobra.0124s0078.1
MDAVSPKRWNKLVERSEKPSSHGCTSINPTTAVSCVALDSFDAVRTPQPYRNPVRLAAAVLQLLQQAVRGGTHTLQARAPIHSLGDQTLATAGGMAEIPTATAAAGALFKVASSESSGAHFQVNLVSDLQPCLVGTSSSASLDSADVEDAFGRLLSASTYFAPRLHPQVQGVEAPAPQELTPMGCIVVIGGLGGLGLLTGMWTTLQSDSVTAVLLGRSGRAEKPPRGALARMQSSQGCVSTRRCDAGSLTEVDSLVRDLLQQRNEAPVTHVVHASGTLQDSLLSGQSTASLRTVSAPKVAAWVKVGQALAMLPVMRPVLCSSIAGILGSAGQASYAAANAVLDAMAAHQSHQGTSSVSIQWGAWAGVGMAADPALLRTLGWRGYGALQPHEGLAVLTMALVSLPTASLACTSAPVLMASVFDWPIFLKIFPPVEERQRQGFYSALEGRIAGAAYGSGLHGLPEMEEHPYTTVHVRSTVDAVYIRKQIAEFEIHCGAFVTYLGLDGMQVGLDSLAALDLRNGLSAAFGVALPVTLAFDYPTPASIAAHLFSLAEATASRTPSQAESAVGEGVATVLRKGISAGVGSGILLPGKSVGLGSGTLLSTRSMAAGSGVIASLKSAGVGSQNVFDSLPFFPAEYRPSVVLTAFSGAYPGAIETVRMHRVRCPFTISHVKPWIAAVLIGSKVEGISHEIDGVAGLTGAFAAVCALRYSVLPPVLNLRNVNPYVSTTLQDWQYKAKAVAVVSRSQASIGRHADKDMLAGAVEVRNEMARAVGIELPSTLIYDYPTVTAIVDYVMRAYAPSVDQPPASHIIRHVGNRFITCSCWSLRSGSSQQGLSAGVNFPMNWETTFMFGNAGMLSPEGRCKTLDARADGYVRAEACLLLCLSFPNSCIGTDRDGLGTQALAKMLIATVERSEAQDPNASSRAPIHSLPVPQAAKGTNLHATLEDIITAVTVMLTSMRVFERLRDGAQAGLDSLAAVELRNAVASRFGISVPATLAFDYPTLDAIASFVERSSRDLFPTSASSRILEVPMHQADALTCTSHVLGIAARYPTGPDCPRRGVKAFWESLTAAANLQTVVPPDRWDIDAAYSPDLNSGNMYVRFGCFVEGARILLEQVAEVLTGPQGMTANVLGSTGVYIGCMYTEYLDSVLGPRGIADTASQAIVGHGLSFLVGRVSFTFGLQGPCVSTDTACSSSLVALHLAHQALSPVGRCRTFDASGDGYGRGEAFTVVLLGESSIGQKQCIGGAVLGSAVNQDGRSSSLTAPNGPSQQVLIAAALEDAALAQGRVEFVALHGTGTPLGDPIEAGALGKALGRDHGACGGVLSVGSNKACYGHTEGTAGVTGALLALLTLERAEYAPVLNLRNTNSYVEAALTTWQRAGGQALGFVPRQTGPRPVPSGMPAAGTSSFGMSGVNAHLIVAPSHDSPQTLQPTRPTPGLIWRKAYTWPAPSSHLLLTQVAGKPDGSENSVTLMGPLNRAALAYLWDHQVLDRALLAGSALFEAAHAAVVHMHQDVHALAVLARAAIMAPCILPDGGQKVLLTCQVDQSSGNVTVRTTQPHLHGWACTLRLSQSRATNEVPTWASPVIRALTPQFWSRSRPGESQGVPQLARVSQPTPSSGYTVNPAVGDCTIHLGAVQSSSHPTRVPVSVGAWGNNGSSSVCPSFDWAIAHPRGVDSDGAARNNMRCCSASRPVQAQIHGLLAKVLPRKVATATADSLEYVVQWQTARAGSRADAGCLADAIEVQSSGYPSIVRGATLWRVSGKGAASKNILLTYRKSCTRRFRGPWGSCAMMGLEAAATFQLQHVQMLLQKHWNPKLELQLVYHAPPNAANELGRVSNPASILQSAAAHGLLKVVAAEFGDPNLQLSAVGHVGGYNGRNYQRSSKNANTGADRPTSLPSGPSSTDRVLSDDGGGGVHGLVASAGSLLAPRLIADTPLIPLVTASSVQPGIHRMVGYSVTFSSIAGLLGSAGQANYAAANSILDSFAVLQQQMFRDNTFPAMEDVRTVIHSPRETASTYYGEYIVKIKDVKNVLSWHTCDARTSSTKPVYLPGAAIGSFELTLITLISWTVCLCFCTAMLYKRGEIGLGEEGVAHRESALRVCMCVCVRACAMVTGASFLWDRLLVAGRELQPFFSEFATVHLSKIQESTDSEKEQQLKLTTSHKPARRSSSDREDKARKVQDVILAMAQRIMGAPASPEAPLIAAGMDSLGAVEMRKDLTAAFGVDLPPTFVFDYPSTAEMTTAILALLPEESHDAEDLSRQSPNRDKIAVASADGRLPSNAIPTQSVIDMVTGAVKDILGVELAAEAPIMASGLDSLGATDLRKGLVDKTGLELPSTLVFDYPTISALSDFIRPQILKLSGTATQTVVAGMEAPQAVVQAQPDVHLFRSTETAVSLHPISSVLPPINPNAPKLTKKGYFTVPPLKRLQRLRDEQLQPLWSSGSKIVARLVPLGLHHTLNPAEEDVTCPPPSVLYRFDCNPRADCLVLTIYVVTFDCECHKGYHVLKGAVPILSVIGDTSSQPSCKVSKGLGTCRKMQVKQKDQFDKFRQKLVDVSGKLGGIFVHYDGDTWMMKVDKF